MRVDNYDFVLNGTNNCKAKSMSEEKPTLKDLPGSCTVSTAKMAYQHCSFLATGASCTNIALLSTLIVAYRVSYESHASIS